MDAYLAIVSRREVRRYAERPLPPEAERRILQAGRVAGSSQNKQPWTFVVVRDGQARERVADAVYVADNVRGAALVVAIVATGSGGLDIGRAAQNMMLAAWADGIGSVPNGVADREAMDAAIGAGEGERVAIVLTFGFPERPVDPERRSPEEWIARADRRPYEDVVREL